MIRELKKEIHEIKNSLNVPVENILTRIDTNDDNHDKDDCNDEENKEKATKKQYDHLLSRIYKPCLELNKSLGQSQRVK